MMLHRWLGISIFTAGCGIAFGQAPGRSAPPQVPANAPSAGRIPAQSVWTVCHRRLTQLSAQAAVKSSFTLDRSMISAASGLMAGTDGETKQAIAKLDGVSVHMLPFGQASR